MFNRASVILINIIIIPKSPPSKPSNLVFITTLAIFSPVKLTLTDRV